MTRAEYNAEVRTAFAEGASCVMATICAFAAVWAVAAMVMA